MKKDERLPMEESYFVVALSSPPDKPQEQMKPLHCRKQGQDMPIE
jgi:hypothetical protein